MLISDCWLVLSYQYEGIREASFGFALSSAAGLAYAPTHLVRILTANPASSWEDLLDCLNMAEEEALTQSGDSIPSPLMFQRTEEGILWETCHGTITRLNTDLLLEVGWPLYNEREVSILEESVRRRALTPLNYPDQVTLRATVDGETVDFSLSLDGLFETVVAIARRCNTVGEFWPLDELVQGIVEGDVVSLLAGLDSWEESQTQTL
jgi:hypothetical protein